MVCRAALLVVTRKESRLTFPAQFCVCMSGKLLVDTGKEK